MNIIKIWVTSVALTGLVLLSSGYSVSVTAATVEQKLQLAMKSQMRSEAEVKRDRNRTPMQALKFWGFKDDMRVIELVPASGWYTKLLAPILAERGELYLVSYPRYLTELDGFIGQAPYNKAKKTFIDMDWDFKNRHYILNTDNFGLNNIDMVLNIREYHNFVEGDRAKLNKAAFDALKSGGSYVVVDHTRRHMSEETAELWRREDPVKVILEVQAAGFKLDRSSDMFYRPDDQLKYEVGRKTVAGNTDRFTLIFKKP
jgi:predicted methyltransferase